jgi:hypothetical protein
MNAAVETSRSEAQRRRPSLVQKRREAGDVNVGGAQALSVLIRLPNLDAPRSTVRLTTNMEATGERLEEKTSRASAKTQTSASPVTANAPSPHTFGNLMGWAWRMLILAAAVGLVLLAYRIINGPAAAPEPEKIPPVVNVVANAEQETESAELLAPTATPLPPKASDIAAPSTLAPPQLELETPVQVSPVETGALQSTPPSRIADDNAPGVEAATLDDRRPWATDVKIETPRSDAPIRTARSEWDDGWNRGGRDDEQPAPDPSPNEEYEWDSTDASAPSYDYPETNPNSWRDDGRWESTPRNAPPQTNGAAVPAWNERAPSAMRPREPGVARLHGEIEQPPLRRDDERNRPGIY